MNRNAETLCLVCAKCVGPSNEHTHTRNYYKLLLLSDTQLLSLLLYLLPFGDGVTFGKIKTSVKLQQMFPILVHLCVCTCVTVYRGKLSGSFRFVFPGKSMR